MTKLAIVFSVVLFASAGNAFSWSETLQNMQKNVQEVTDAVISKLEAHFESTQTKAASNIVELENETNKYGSRVSEELSAMSSNFSHEVNKLADDVDKVIVKECIKSDDKATLAHLSEAVMTKTGECIDDKINSVVECVESIKNVSNKALAEIVEIKKKAEHCADDMSDSKSAFSAILCSKSTAARATWASMKAAPKWTAKWAKLKFLMVTLQSSLHICTQNERINLQQESSTLLKKTKECVQQKLDENTTYKIHKSEEDFAY